MFPIEFVVCRRVGLALHEAGYVISFSGAKTVFTALGEADLWMLLSVYEELYPSIIVRQSIQLLMDNKKILSVHPRAKRRTLKAIKRSEIEVLSQRWSFCFGGTVIVSTEDKDTALSFLPEYLKACHNYVLGQPVFNEQGRVK